jgi:hypothetical protein
LAGRSEGRAELPEPVCPQGAVIGLGADEANLEPPAPGTSPLDDGLRRIERAMADESDESDAQGEDAS